MTRVQAVPDCTTCKHVMPRTGDWNRCGKLNKPVLSTHYPRFNGEHIRKCLLNGWREEKVETNNDR